MHIGKITAFALSLALAGPALSAVTVVNGTIVEGDTFNRPLSGTPPVLLSGVGTNVFYDTYSFSVSADGVYNISLDSIEFDPFMALYAGSFDPSQPLVNALAADDDGGEGLNSFLSSSLMTGMTYIAVLTTFGNGETGAYTLTFDGPGNILPSGGGVVPEPATWAMLIAGFGLVGVAMRRRSAVRA